MDPDFWIRNKKAEWKLIIFLFWWDTNLATRRRHLHQLLVFIAMLATRWCQMYWFKFLPPGSAICIGSKFGLQVVLFTLPQCLGLLFWYLHWPESHQSSQQNWQCFTFMTSKYICIWWVMNKLKKSYFWVEREQSKLGGCSHFISPGRLNEIELNWVSPIGYV